MSLLFSPTSLSLLASSLAPFLKYSWISFFIYVLSVGLSVAKVHSYVDRLPSFVILSQTLTHKSGSSSCQWYSRLPLMHNSNMYH
ncbi:hypothetical protein HD554DRAFT_2046871 [Boletus coccyginus]|nr:hypothetical protein HD554DRAFT_2046871 [Boletus coccyginus]